MNKPNTMDLTIEAVKDFQMCGRLYDYRHATALYEPISRREMITLRYDSTVRAVVSFFFFKRQGGVTPSYGALTNRWEKQWFPKDTDAYDIIYDQHEPNMHKNPVSYTTDAVRVLMNFHEHFSQDHRDPIIINEPFAVPIDRDITFRGSFDLVLRDAKTKRVSVIKWTTQQRRPSHGSIMMDFAALKYAMDHRNREKGPQNIDYYIYDLGTTKQELIKIDVTKADVNAFLYWAREIRDTEVFPSRFGLTAYCKRCPYSVPCSKWVAPEQVVTLI